MTLYTAQIVVDLNIEASDEGELDRALLTIENHIEQTLPDFINRRSDLSTDYVEAIRKAVVKHEGV
jgi:hypothetical protein